MSQRVRPACLQNSKTWSSGEASLQLGRQIALAIANAIPLLLVHEVNGISDEDGRYGCKFDLFFRPDQTPRAYPCT